MGTSTPAGIATIVVGAVCLIVSIGFFMQTAMLGR